MKTFLFFTSTNEDWEITGGAYLVRANDENSAKEKLEKLLIEQNEIHEYGERISYTFDITDETEFKDDIFIIECPIIE